MAQDFRMPAPDCEPTCPNSKVDENAPSELPSTGLVFWPVHWPMEFERTVNAIRWGGSGPWWASAIVNPKLHKAVFHPRCG